MPRFSSISVTSSSRSLTCEALSTFVTAMPFTSGVTACSRSRTASESGRLIRTTTSAPPRFTRAGAFSTSVRARSFSEGGTLSSRSSWITSAPRVCALSTYFSTFTGTYMRERQTSASVFMRCSCRTFSFERQPRVLDHLAPARDLAVDVLCELLRGHRDRLRAFRRVARFELRRLHRLAQRIREALDELRRRPARRREA